MDNKEHFKTIKEIIELHEYIETIGVDRPKLSEILKSIAIDPRTMWNCVASASQAARMALPEYSLNIVNTLFKLGVTIGYKAAIEKQMKRDFLSDDVPPEEKDDE